MPNGDYPILDREDLQIAIDNHEHAKDVESARTHITSRAKALGADGLVAEPLGRQHQAGRQTRSRGAQPNRGERQYAPGAALQGGDALGARGNPARGNRFGRCARRPGSFQALAEDADFLSQDWSIK